MSKPGQEAAFPTPDVYQDGNVLEYGQNGMTLRDYFAAHAPVSFADAVIACDNHRNAPDSQTAICRVLVQGAAAIVEAMAMLAKLRGQYADAMIAERAKP